MRELETLLEEEKSQRAQALSIKKQMEAELQEAEAQVEAATRGREEALRQIKRLQVIPNFCCIRRLLFAVKYKCVCKRKWSQITSKCSD